MNFRFDDMMYFKYCIGPVQLSLNFQSDLYLQLLQVQVLLVVEEFYSLHRLALLIGLQLNHYIHIENSFQTPGVVSFGNINLFSYG